MRGEAMAHGVRRDRFMNAGLVYGAFEIALKSLVIRMMAANHAGARIGGMVRLRKHPEPCPTGARLRILSMQRVRHEHAGFTRRHIA